MTIKMRLSAASRTRMEESLARRNKAISSGSVSSHHKNVNQNAGFKASKRKYLAFNERFGLSLFFLLLPDKGFGGKAAEAGVISASLKEDRLQGRHCHASATSALDPVHNVHKHKHSLQTFKGSVPKKILFVGFYF